MARVPLREPDELTDEQRARLEEYDVGVINLLRTTLNNPDAGRAYLEFGIDLWEASKLSPRERELFILTAARSLRSKYEWHQHVRIAREVGVSEGKIHAIGSKDLSRFDGGEGALVRYSRAIAIGQVSNDVYEDLWTHYDVAIIRTITFLGSRYVGTARFVSAFDIPLEGEFVGWKPDSPSNP